VGRRIFMQVLRRMNGVSWATGRRLSRSLLYGPGNDLEHDTAFSVRPAPER